MYSTVIMFNKFRQDCPEFCVISKNGGLKCEQSTDYLASLPAVLVDHPWSLSSGSHRYAEKLTNCKINFEDNLQWIENGDSFIGFSIFLADCFSGFGICKTLIYLCLTHCCLLICTSVSFLCA